MKIKSSFTHPGVVLMLYALLLYGPQRENFYPYSGSEEQPASSFLKKNDPMQHKYSKCFWGILCEILCIIKHEMQCLEITKKASLYFLY